MYWGFLGSSATTNIASANLFIYMMQNPDMLTKIRSEFEAEVVKPYLD